MSPMALRELLQRVWAWAQHLWRASPPKPQGASDQRRSDSALPSEAVESGEECPSQRPGTDLLLTGDVTDSAKPNKDNSSRNAEPEPVSADPPDKPPSASVNEPRTTQADGSTRVPDAIRGGASEATADGTKLRQQPRSGPPGGGPSPPALPRGLGDAKTRGHPRDIGGRRNQPTSTARTKTTRASVARPELVCRRPTGDSRWELALSADTECPIRNAYHDQRPLGSRHGEYPLSSFLGRLTFEYEGGPPDEVSLFNGEPLIFKLPKKWQGNGRRVRGISKGYFIVIAPNEWTRTGHVPVEAESCIDASFTAHFFFRDGGGESNDRIGGFLECEVRSITSAFSLAGHRVPDDSADGDLFVGDAPELKLLQDVAWVRTGEEKEDGWKGRNFRAGNHTLAEVLNGRQGRFFVRVYDAGANLLDSGEFRYLRRLKEIRVNGQPYTEQTVLVPSSTGHPPTEIRFIGIDGATVRAILPREWKYAEVQHDGLVEVKPHPSGDRMSCDLECDDERVAIVLNLPRIWWRLESGRSQSAEWRDTPWSVTRQAFREHALNGAAISLRLPRRVKRVHVGFDTELERAYSHRTDTEEFRLPLADFADYSHVERRLHVEAWLNVDCGGATLPLLRVLADPAPMIQYFTCTPDAAGVRGQGTLHWKARNTEVDGVVIEPQIGPVQPSGSLKVMVARTTTYTLRLVTPGIDDVVATATLALSLESDKIPVARVRRATGGWKRGRGFSYSELRSAGLTVLDARRWGIRVDKRRRSTHRVNVEAIRRLVDGRREQHTSVA